MQNGTATAADLKKIERRIIYDSAIPLLSIYLKELKAGTRTDICAPMFIAALFTIAQRWGKKTPTQMDKQNVIYPNNGI